MSFNGSFDNDVQNYLWHLYKSAKKDLTKYLCSVSADILIWILCYWLLCAFIYLLTFRFNIRINKKLKNAKRTLFVVAHPDDECMFFGPSILNLIQQGIDVHFLCLSVGDYEGQGSTRQSELWRACSALGIKEERITLYIDTLMPDDPGRRWPTERVADVILQHIEANSIDSLITFDKEGVSSHVNHSSIFYAIAFLTIEKKIPKGCRVFTLDSVNVLRKYWSYLDLPLSFLLSSNRYILSLQDRRTVVSAMKMHKSQMLWFRHLYLMFSRFLVINTLKEVTLPDVELDLELDD